MDVDNNIDDSDKPAIFDDIGNFAQIHQKVKMDGFGIVTKVELRWDIVSEIKEEKENEE